LGSDFLSLSLFCREGIRYVASGSAADGRELASVGALSVSCAVICSLLVSGSIMGSPITYFRYLLTKIRASFVLTYRVGLSLVYLRFHSLLEQRSQHHTSLRGRERERGNVLGEDGETLSLTYLGSNARVV